MNPAIEMHDSECVSIERDESGQGSVLFNAYVHRMDDDPGVESWEGGIQPIRMKFKNMIVEGEIGQLPAYVYEGSLTIGGAIQDNLVPFPADYLDTARLTMMLSDDARTITISGIGVSIQPKGEFRFVEICNFSKVPTSTP